MKKILITLSILICAFASFGQYNPSQLLPGSSPNNLLNTNGGGVRANFIAYIYADTTAANFCKCAAYDGAFIVVDTVLYIRFHNGWFKTGSGGSGGNIVFTSIINPDSSRYVYSINGIPSDSVSTLVLKVQGAGGTTVTQSHDTVTISSNPAFSPGSHLISTGGISLVDSTVTIAGPIIVQCDEGIPVTVGTYSTVIPAVLTGYYQVTLIGYDCGLPGIDTIQGIKDTATAIPPALPAGWIAISYVIKFGNTTNTPTIVYTYQQTAVTFIDSNGHISTDSVGGFTYIKATKQLNVGGTIASNNFGGTAFKMNGGSAIRAIGGSGVLVLDGGLSNTNSGVTERTGSAWEHYMALEANGQVFIGDNLGTFPPPNSAKLEIRSTTQGLLPPRMTGVQMNAIASPATGLTVYCTDSSALCLYYSGAWHKLGSGGNGSSQNISNAALRWNGDYTQHVAGHNLTFDSIGYALFYHYEPGLLGLFGSNTGVFTTQTFDTTSNRIYMFGGGDERVTDTVTLGIRTIKQQNADSYNITAKSSNDGGNGINILHIDSTITTISGNVGIGTTTTPDSSLTVAHGIALHGLFESVDATDSMVVKHGNGGIGVRALGGGGSQTPWASDINGAGFNLSNVGNVTATNFTGDGSGITGLPFWALTGTSTFTGDCSIHLAGHNWEVTGTGDISFANTGAVILDPNAGGEFINSSQGNGLSVGSAGGIIIESKNAHDFTLNSAGQLIVTAAGSVGISSALYNGNFFGIDANGIYMGDPNGLYNGNYILLNDATNTASINVTAISLLTAPSSGTISDSILTRNSSGVIKRINTNYFAQQSVLSDYLLKSDSTIYATVTALAAKGSGTVINIATGLGLSGGTITTTGTLLVDTSSASILSRQRAAATYATLSLLSNTPTIVKFGSIIAQTTAANIFTYTTGAADSSFEVAARVTITALSVNVVTCTVTYTDETNASRTLTFFPMGATSATLSVGASNFAVMGEIRVKASTTVTVAVTATGIGSETYNAGATLIRLHN